MSKYVWLVLSSVLSFLAACSTAPPEERVGKTEQPFTSNATANWTGMGTICGVCNSADGNYGCANTPSSWNNGIATFADPTPSGSLVTGVQVTVYGVSCAEPGAVNPTVTVRLNGLTLGSYADPRTCQCDSCDPPHAFSMSNAGGIPGYVYGGTNSVQLVLSNAAPCVDRAEVSLTVVDPTLSPSPTSLTFGNQAINTTSAPQTITITNTRV
jgi:hypothetical protein